VTRRLLVAFAALLALGATLDATLYLDHVGAGTIGADARGRAAETGELRDRSVPTPIERARGRKDERYGVYVALHDLAPAATVLRDGSVRTDRLSSTLLTGIGAASDVRSVDVGPVALPATAPDASGTDEHGPWTLRVASGRVAAVLAVRDVDGTHLVDVRLLPPTIAAGLPEAPSVSPGPDRSGSQPAPSLGRAVVGETLVIVLLLLVGGLLLPRRGAGRETSRGQRIPLALLVGVALHAALGLLLLPEAWGLAATVAVGVLRSAVGARGEVALGWRRSDVGPLALAATAILGMVAVSRWAGFFRLTPDSFDYWAGGAALSVGTFGLADLDLKRGLGQQALHSAGFVAGAAGLQALSVVAIVAGAAVLLANVSAKGVRRREVIGAAALLIVALLVSPQTWAFATYLNSHVLISALLLALVMLLGDGTDPAMRRALLPAVGAIITALVVMRAEGAPLVGLVLLGTLAVRTERPVWRGAWVVLAGAASVWAGLLVLAQGPAIATLLVVAVAPAALAIAVGGASVGPAARRAVPWVAGTLLWGLTVVLLRRDEVRFIEVAVKNLGMGEGGWGVLGPLLILAGVLGVLHTSDAQDVRTVTARWLLIGFIPLTVIAKLGDGSESGSAGLDVFLAGGGRPGWGDSANRMWMHAVLLLLLVLVAAVRDSDARPRQRSDTLRLARMGADGALAIAGMWVVLQWQPVYVLTTTPPEEVVLLSVDGSDPAGELTDGSDVAQSVALSPPDRSGLSPDLRPTKVCADLPIVTYGRPVEGRITIELRVDRQREVTEIPGKDIVDWQRIRTCLELARDDLEDATLEIRVAGIGAPSGAAPSVLLGSAAGFGALVTLVGEDGTPVQRRADHLVVDVTLEGQRPLVGTELLPARSILFLPWLAIAVGAASVVARWRTSGHARRRPAMAAPAEAPRPE